jgi:hypothetical protein
MRSRLKTILVATAIAGALGSSAFAFAAADVGTLAVSSRDGGVSADQALSRSNPVVPDAVVVGEDFADVPALISAGGWLSANHSSPVGGGVTSWTQCGAAGVGVAPAYDGGPSSCAVANYCSAGSADCQSGSGTISNWLLTKPITFAPNMIGSFYTRTGTGAAYADRLEVRVCSSGDCSNYGTTATDVGNFTTTVLTINPNLAAGPDPTGANGYPDVWTRFVIPNLPTSGTGRIAFRYYVTSGGPAGANSSIVGIDRVVVSDGISTYAVTSSVDVSGHGTISPSATVPEGDVTTFTLTPDTGYKIGSVGGTCGGTLNRVAKTFTTSSVSADCTVVASFVVDTGDLVCSGPLNHVVQASSAGTYINWITGQFSDGTSITPYHFNPYGSTNLTFYLGTSTGNGARNALAASAASGGNWLRLQPGDSIGAASTFAKSAATLANWRGTSNIDGYIGFRMDCSTLASPPASGTCYGYAHMTTTGNASSTGQPATIVDYCYDSAGNTITIPTAPVTYTVTPSVTGSGSISPNTAQTVNSGDTKTFTLSADTGNHLVDVTGTCGGTLTGTTSYTTNAVTADCTVVANFAVDAPVTYTVTPSVTGSGSISPNTAQTVNSGDTKTFTLSADTGNHLVDVTGTCGGTLTGTTSYTTSPVTVDCTVIANFAADTGNPNIVCHNNINHTLAATTSGTSFNWTTGVVGDEDPTPPTGGPYPYDMNIWNSSGLSAYWSHSPTISAAVAPSTSSAAYSVLHAGDVVGASSIWSRTAGAMTTFKAGVDGYLGVRFDCSSIGGTTCYGYAHFTTTAATGYPRCWSTPASTRAARTSPSAPVRVVRPAWPRPSRQRRYSPMPTAPRRSR